MSLNLIPRRTVSQLTFRWSVGARRSLTSSPRTAKQGEEPKGAHPESHASIRVSTGNAFADGAKEKEGPISGIPRSQEAHAGESPSLVDL
jgi:hypothetical protein